jgi:hypothetical protein
LLERLPVTGTVEFKFFLLDKRNEPLDPVAFVTAIPNWAVGETFSVGSGETFRILEIRTDVTQDVLDAGFNGVFVVEPAAET